MLVVGQPIQRSKNKSSRAILRRAKIRGRIGFYTYVVILLRTITQRNSYNRTIVHHGGYSHGYLRFSLFGGKTRCAFDRTYLMKIVPDEDKIGQY